MGKGKAAVFPHPLTPDPHPLFLFAQLARALFLQALALALKLRVLQAVGDALLGAPLDGLHLGLDARLDLIDGRRLARLLLRDKFFALFRH